MLALAAVVAADGPVVLVIALTALASAAGTAERPAAMALLPRLVGESRLGAGERAAAHRAGPRRRRRSGARRAPARRRARLRWPSSSTGARSRSRRVLISTMRRRSAPVGERESAAAVAQIAHGFRTSRADTVRRAALPRRGHGRVHLRRPDRAAGRVRRAAARSRRGWLRRAARRGRSRWAAERDRQRAARDEQRGSRVIVVTAGAFVCATQLAYAGRRRARVALGGDRGRRRGPRRLRGGRRDRARPHRRRRRARPRHGGVRRRCRWRRWWRARCSRPS